MNQENNNNNQQTGVTIGSINKVDNKPQEQIKKTEPKTDNKPQEQIKKTEPKPEPKTEPKTIPEPSTEQKDSDVDMKDNEVTEETQTNPQSNPPQPQETPNKIHPDSVDWIVSHAVLEDEKMKVMKQIAELKRSQQDTDELELRLQIITTKIQVLLIQIDTGLLNMEAYVEVINKKIAEEQAAIKEYYKIDKEVSKRCLYRIKVMKKEIGLE